MQPCTRCGNPNADENIFCGKCGHKLNNNCPVCGFINLPGQKFCGNCGKQLIAGEEVEPPASRQAEPEPVASSKKRLEKLASQPAPPVVPQAQSPEPPKERLREQVREENVSPPSSPAETSQLTPPEQPDTQTSPVSELPLTERPSQDATPREPLSSPPSPQAGWVESSPLDATLGLEEYALLSLEFLNFPQLAGTTDDPNEIEQFKRDCFTFVEERATAANGLVELARNQLLFVGFPHENSLEESAHKAIRFSLKLLSEEFRMKDVTVQFRIGVDIKTQGGEQSITSATERSLARPGTVVISEPLYKLVRKQYTVETIGPLPIGEQMRTFYRILRVASETAPLKEQFLQAEVKQESSPHSELRSEPSVMSPYTESDATPEMGPPPRQPSASSILTPQREPEKVTYQPPVLVMRKATRTSNLSYQQAIEALTAEFSTFLDSQSGKPTGKTLSVSASDGLGKSNIIQIARYQVDQESQKAIWLGAQNYRRFEHTNLPLMFWTEMMLNTIGLSLEGYPEQDVIQQAEQFLTHIFEPSDPATDLPAPRLAEFRQVLLELLSVNPLKPLTIESREKLGLLDEFLFHLLITMATKKPVVLVIEDLAWMDTASLDVLANLLKQNLLQHPVMLVLTHTRDLYPTGTLEQALQWSPYRELVISDLNHAESLKFLDDGPLGGNLREFPEHWVETLLEYAHGLPLYLEESLRLLHLQGFLSVHPETFKFIPAEEQINGPIHLPDTLMEVIRKRLSFLSDDARYLLELASVLGERFQVGLLLALSQAEEQEFAQLMNELFNHGFLMPDAVSTGRFRHGQLWQAIYSGIDPETRKQMHQLVSESLESDINNKTTVNPALMAFHAEEGDLLNRAFSYWNLTGIQAAHAGSLVGMNLAMFHALDLLDTAKMTGATAETRELESRIHENLSIFNILYNPELVSRLLQWVVYYQSQEGNTAKLFEAYGLLSSSFEYQGQFESALESLERSLNLLNHGAYPLEELTLLASKVEYLYILGKQNEARSVFENQITPLSQRHSLTSDPEAFNAYLSAKLILAQVLITQCDNTAFSLIEEIGSFSREREMEGLNIASQLALGTGFIAKGNYEACERQAISLLNQIEVMPDNDWFLAQWGLLSMAYHCELGHWDSARQLTLTVLSKSEEVKDFHTWIQAQNFAGRIEFGQGNYTESKKILEQAIYQSAEHKFATTALQGWRFLTETELALGNLESALELSENALRIASKPDIDNTRERFLLTNQYALCMMRQGNIKQAGKLLEAQWPEVIKTRFSPLVADTAYAIGTLYKSLASNAPSELSKKNLQRSIEFYTKARSIWRDLRNTYQIKVVEAALPGVHRPVG